MEIWWADCVVQVELKDKAGGREGSIKIRPCYQRYHWAAQKTISRLIVAKSSQGQRRDLVAVTRQMILVVRQAERMRKRLFFFIFFCRICDSICIVWLDKPDELVLR